jgi:hypothetical protein
MTHNIHLAMLGGCHPPEENQKLKGKDEESRVRGREYIHKRDACATSKE